MPLGGEGRTLINIQGRKSGTLPGVLKNWYKFSQEKEEIIISFPSIKENLSKDPEVCGHDSL